MAAQKKPTAQQIAQGKARAGGNNPVKVTKAGVKRLGQAALIAASLTPAGRGVKVAATAAKAAKAGSTARALKAAQGPSLAKGSKKLEATLGSVERAKVKMKAQDNMIAGDSKKTAYANAAKKIMTPSERLKLAKTRAVAEKAKTISKALKNK